MACSPPCSPRSWLTHSPPSPHSPINPNTSNTPALSAAETPDPRASSHNPVTSPALPQLSHTRTTHALAALRTLPQFCASAANTAPRSSSTCGPYAAPKMPEIDPIPANAPICTPAGNEGETRETNSEWRNGSDAAATTRGSDAMNGETQLEGNPNTVSTIVCSACSVI